MSRKPASACCSKMLRCCKNGWRFGMEMTTAVGALYVWPGQGPAVALAIQAAMLKSWPLSDVLWHAAAYQFIHAINVSFNLLARRRSQMCTCGSRDCGGG